MQLIDCFLWMLMEQITLVNPTGWECYLPFSLTVILTAWVLVFQVFEPVICHSHSRFWFNLIPEQEKTNKQKKCTILLNTQCNVLLLSSVFSLVPCMVWNKSVHNLTLLGDWQSHPRKYINCSQKGTYFPILSLRYNLYIGKFLPSF